MPHEVGPDELIGSWLHSHEEDTGDRMVFRPEDYDFPPVRAPRYGLDLRAGGELKRTGGASPDDRGETSAGSWRVEGGELRLDTAGGRSEAFGVESAENDRLVLRRLE